MNDLEHDLRELLAAKAAQAKAPAHPPTPVLKRARRRQAITSAAAGIAAVLIAVGSFAGLRALLVADGAVPGVQGPTVTQTLGGITLGYPKGWFLVDPVAAGIQPADPPGELPRMVLMLSTHDPVGSGIVGCPGRSGAEGAETDGILMTIQEEPLALVGERAAPWPVRLERMRLGPDSGDSACYPDWEFHRAGWSAVDRSFEARVGLAPDVSAADRQALFDAFASMRFAQAEPGTPTAAVLATGTAAGEHWTLTASRDAGQLELQLDYETGAVGFGGLDLAEDLDVFAHRFGGENPEIVVFGVVSGRVDAVTVIQSGARRTTGPLDIPDDIVPELGAFVLTMPDLSGEVVATDSDGVVLDRLKLSDAKRA